MDTLKDFYEQHYKAHMSKELSYEHMSTVLDYLSTDVITMYENNIKQNYVEYVEWYVNVSWRKKEGQGRPAQIIPPEDAAPPLPRVDRQAAQTRAPCEKSEKGQRPLRHLVLVAGLPPVHAVHDEGGRGARHERQERMSTAQQRRAQTRPHNHDLACEPLLHKGTRQANRLLERGRLDGCKESFWGFFFKTNMKYFHAKGYTFDHQIVTDSVDCSIRLKRKVLSGERVIQERIGKCGTYIDEVVDCEPLKDKTVVAIDPNMSDLLYCVDGDTKDQPRFRYTQDTRRRETKAKKHQDYIQERKQVRADGKRIIEWEAELSAYNRKTSDFERFKACVEKKNEMNRCLR